MKRAVGIVLLLVIVVAAGVAGTAWTRLKTPYKGYASSEQFVEIPSGAGAAVIRQRLLDAGVVQDGWTLRLALRWTGASRDLKAGEYRFDRPMTAVEVVEKIAHGDVYGQRITFPEGLTIREMAALYEMHGLGNARDFIAASRNVALIQDLDPAASDLEGYLFPDTYIFAYGTSPRVAVREMVTRFEHVWDPAWNDRLQQLAMSRNDIVTLASIIEREARRPEERPVISAVYHNRLRLQMPLQADPTVEYALGEHRDRLFYKDLDVESPYNTYRHPGLPPGPIASPGKASLEAALFPAAVPYRYFVASPDGHHEFRTTFKAHSEAVQEARRERREHSSRE